jgi:hypothetical protein
LIFATSVRAFSINNQFPGVFKAVCRDRFMDMVLPEIIIPFDEFPGGLGATGSGSSVEEQEVKNAAPKVAITMEAPVFSRNFLLDSVKLPDLVMSELSIIRLIILFNYE